MDARVERVIDTKIKDIKSQTNQLKVDKAMMALTKIHTDAPEILSSKKFHTWIKEQSKLVQNAILHSLNVEDAADVLERYKTKVLNRAPSKPSRDEDEDEDPRVAHAVKVKGGTAPIVTDEFGGEYLYKESQIQKADARWWETHRDKVQQAMRERKVLMDVTGGAR
jgi:hypothetical protein